MATHSSIFAWKIPWTEEPGGLWSPRELDMPERLSTHTYICIYLYTYAYIKICFYYSLLYLLRLEQYLIYSRSSLNYPLGGWMDEWRWEETDERVAEWMVSPFREEVRRKPAVMP